MTIDLPELLARIAALSDPRQLAKDHGVHPDLTLAELFVAPLPKSARLRALLRDLKYDIPDDEVVVIVTALPPERLGPA